MKNFFNITIPFAAIMLVAAVAAGQTSFNPENLGSGVNTQYSEVNPILSRDGKMLFFTRVNHPSNNYGVDDSQDIWCSTIQPDGTWGLAERLPNSINIARYNALLSALDDGKTYVILGRYTKNGKRWLTRGLSFIERSDDGKWSTPVALKIKSFARVNKGKTVNAYVTPDREQLFMTYSRYPNSKKLSLFVSLRKKNGSYSKPKQVYLGPIGVEEPLTVESPFLTSDKNRLYFSADYTRKRTSNDIFYADKADAKFREFGKPIRVTDTINTPNWDSYFTMNAKESWAYYTSVTNSMGKSDIFRVKVFEENPFVKISGLILNQQDLTLMLTDTNYEILVNGEQFPGLNVDKASASFDVLLPLGRLYTFLPVMQNWNGLSIDVDLRDVREYSEAKLNLFFSSIPYAQVKGRVIDSQTNEMLPLSLKPSILINGLPSDSIRFDQFSGAFQALLPLGANYTFTAKVDNYTVSSVDVDVSSESTFVEKIITLTATTVPWVEISGQVLDNSSLTPIALDAQPKFLINGQETDSVSIDPVTGAYRVRLPFGVNYVLGVKANNYKILENKLDLSTYDRYAALKQNVFAEREDANMVTLSGKVIDTKTGKQLEEGYHVNMRVNGVESPAFVYDSKSAEYTLRLPVGFNYDLTPSVINFYNKFEPVDLSKATPMTKVVRNFYVTPIEVGQSIDIENIYFETGRAGLKPESFRSLNALIAFLNEYPNVRVEIGGHTDNVGTAAVNNAISDDRARAVAKYVIDQGIPAHRVESKGYGFTKPKASNKTAEGRAQNRRVDFTITGI